MRICGCGLLLFSFHDLYLAFFLYAYYVVSHLHNYYYYFFVDTLPNSMGDGINADCARLLLGRTSYTHQCTWGEGTTHAQIQVYHGGKRCKTFQGWQASRYIS